MLLVQAEQLGAEITDGFAQTLHFLFLLDNFRLRPIDNPIRFQAGVLEDHLSLMAGFPNGSVSKLLRTDKSRFDFVLFAAVFFNFRGEDIDLFEKLCILSGQGFDLFLLLNPLFQQGIVRIADLIDEIIDIFCTISGKIRLSETNIDNIIERKHNFLIPPSRL